MRARLVKISLISVLLVTATLVWAATPIKSAFIGKQTWNLKDADIRAVIRTVSILTSKSFIIDQRVKGSVTFISQKPMTVAEIYQAFLSMLQVLGYEAIPLADGAVKIVPAMLAKVHGDVLASRLHAKHSDQVVVRVVAVNHVSASQLVPILHSMMPDWSHVDAYLPSNSLILVGSADNLSRLVSIIHKMDSKSANLTSIVHLHHAIAKNLVTILQSLQSGIRSENRVVNVAIVSDDRSNSILLNGNIENITRMKHLIDQLDRTVAHDDKTTVVSLNYLEAKKLAPILMKVASGKNAGQLRNRQTSLGGLGINSSVSVQAEENDNAIILHGSSDIVHSLCKVIRQLDIRPSQVLVEAIVVKVDETLLSQLGIVWGTVNSNGTSTSTVDSATGVASGQATLGAPNVFAMKVTHGVGFISGGNLSAIIHALRGNTSSDILATPSIVVLNNGKATIADGKNIGLVNRQYSSTVPGTNNEITPFNTIQRQDVTLSLKVTPQISPNNMIRLKIEQQNNSIDPSSTGDIDNPILDVSKIKTHVLVRSGDILVLGGLINRNRVEGVQKIPILGDIPLLGNLFRYKSHRVEKQNLMVFIKPIILNDRIRAGLQTRKRYHYIRSEQMAMKSGRLMSRYDVSVLPDYDGMPHEQSVFLPAPAKTERR